MFFPYLFNTDLVVVKHLCVKNHSVQSGKPASSIRRNSPRLLYPRNLSAACYLLNLTIPGRGNVASQTRPDLKELLVAISSSFSLVF